MDAQSVAAAIEGVGESLTLRKKAGGTFDDDAGEFTVAPTPTDTPFAGFVEHFDARLVNGTTILSGDLKVWAASFGAVVPVAGDLVIRDSRSLRIIAVDPVKQGDEVLTYRLQIRGA